jgi:hypothetical protein
MEGEKVAIEKFWPFPIGIEACGQPHYKAMETFPLFEKLEDFMTPDLLVKMEEHQCSPDTIRIMINLDKSFIDRLETDGFLSSHMFLMQSYWPRCIQYLEPKAVVPLHYDATRSAFLTIQSAFENRVDLLMALVHFYKIMQNKLHSKTVTEVYQYLEQEISSLREAHYLFSYIEGTKIPLTVSYVLPFPTGTTLFDVLATQIDKIEKLVADRDAPVPEIGGGIMVEFEDDSEDESFLGGEGRT